MTDYRRRSQSAVAVESPLMTAQESMAYLRCSRSFMTDHRAALGGIKVGGKLMFRRDGLDAYLDRQQIQAPAPVEPPTTTPIRRPAPSGKGPTNPVTGGAWNYVEAAGRR